jgi:hypothetical protein
MTKKRKRRLGHVTSKEKGDLNVALTNAALECAKKYKGDDGKFSACYTGTKLVDLYMKRKGF